MNILIATDVFPPNSGGSGWSTFHLARALQERGHRTEIVLPKPGLDGTQTRKFEGLDVVEVGYGASRLPGVRAWQRTRALEKTLSAYLAARAGEFELIHAQHQLSISAAIAAKRTAQIPVVSTVRDYWAVCVYGTLWRDNSICPICRGGEITRCLAQRYGRAANLMQPVVPLVERELRRRQRTLQDSDAVISVSAFVAETLRGIVDERNLHVVPNLIDVEETQRIAADPASSVLRPLSAAAPPPFLLFVGKLNVLKGADVLGQILERSGVEMPLIVAGDGELRAELARVNGVELLGWISNAETVGLLGRAQALVFPSRWAEPLARTLLEAQALGVPTVAFNSGGTCDIIENNINGLLADSVDEFAAQLGRLVSNPDLRAKLGANAKRLAQEEFSPDVVVGRLTQVYLSVCHA